MPLALIGIGTNVGDRRANLDAALAALAALPETTLSAFSDIYETAPVGPVDQGAFLNAAAALETRLDPHDLRRRLAEIERQVGRAAPGRRVRWGPRELDLDLLLYDDHVIDSDDLVVPHPRMHERWFVLRPLADVAPDAMHPTLGRTVREMLAAVEDDGGAG